MLIKMIILNKIIYLFTLLHGYMCKNKSKIEYKIISKSIENPKKSKKIQKNPKKSKK